MAKRISASPSPSSAAKRARSSEFHLGIRDLNSAFLTSLRGALTKNQGCVLVPLVKDYLHHSRALMEKNGGGGGEVAPASSSLAELGVFFDEFERNFIKISSKEEEMETEDDANNNKAQPKSAAPLSTVAEEEEPEQPAIVEATPSKQLKRRSVEAAVSPIPGPSGFGALSKFPSPYFLIQKPSPSSGGVGGTRSAIPFGSPAPVGFGFGLPPPSSLTPVASPSFQTPNGGDTVDKREAQEEDEENEEPPKNEVVTVIEKDSVYSTRCKVFGMTDNQYKHKGVGTLYVKLLSEGKFQLVVRADNNLGTLLLNILLNKALPLDKKSAKDVLTFDVLGNKGKGMPILLRVKSEDAANELINELKEYQSQSSN